jgi:hypothetical protein
LVAQGSVAIIAIGNIVRNTNSPIDIPQRATENLGPRSNAKVAELVDAQVSEACGH